MPNDNFSFNVFINCPFDKQYKPLLRALIFTIIDCSLNPRIASESSDSGEARVEKIKSLIRESCYSIHDISRMQPTGAKGLPRFNMPFELGLDLGCRTFGAGNLLEKKCLVLEKKKYMYQKVLSDIAGCDIEAHDDDAQKLVRRTRNWIFANIHSDVLTGSRIWQRYNVFYSHFEQLLNSGGYSRKDIEDMPVREFIVFIENWRISNPK